MRCCGLPLPHFLLVYALTSHQTLTLTSNTNTTASTQQHLDKDTAMGATTRSQTAKSYENLKALPTAPAPPPAFFSQLWATVTSEGSAKDAAPAISPAASSPIEIVDLTNEDNVQSGSTVLPQVVDLTGGEGGGAGTQAASAATASMVYEPYMTRKTDAKARHSDQTNKSKGEVGPRLRQSSLREKS